MATVDDTMPPEGTTERCEFCRETVTLRRGVSGARYWVRPDEDPDGARRCFGGVPPKWDGNLITLHKPSAYAWWYDGAGVAQYPTRFTPRRSA